MSLKSNNLAYKKSSNYSRCYEQTGMVEKRENGTRYIAKLKTDSSRFKKYFTITVVFTINVHYFQFLYFYIWTIKVGSNKIKSTRREGKFQSSAFSWPYSNVIYFPTTDIFMEYTHNSNYKEGTIQNPTFFQMYPHFQPLAKIILYTHPLAPHQVVSLWHSLSQLKHHFLTKAFLSRLEGSAAFLVLEELRGLNRCKILFFHPWGGRSVAFAPKEMGKTFSWYTERSWQLAPCVYITEQSDQSVKNRAMIMWWKITVYAGARRKKRTPGTGGGKTEVLEGLARRPGWLKQRRWGDSTEMRSERHQDGSRPGQMRPQRLNYKTGFYSEWNGD